MQKLDRHSPYGLLTEAPAAAAITEEVPEIPRDTFDNDEGHLAILGDVVYLDYVLVIQEAIARASCLKRRLKRASRRSGDGGF